MGQVLPESKFGQAIRAIALQESLHTFCEVGTWNGQGTTACLYTGRADAQIYSIEGNLPMYEQAVAFWKNAPGLHLLYGTLHRTILSSKEVQAHPRFPLVAEHYRLYYTSEELAVRNAPLVKVPPCDVILLDGGEFSTQGDWDALYHSGLKVVILDDTQVIKTNAIYHFLRQSLRWRCLADVPQDRNGWAIFQRR